MENLLTFISASILIELTPGPNMAFLALISATKGRRHGFATTAGIAIGLLLIGLLSAAGVGALITQNPILFQILRWGGIAYLLYLAWEGWREAGESSPQKAESASSDLTYFRHGLTVNLLNPKAALFYITVLPTFLSSREADWSEIFGLTVLYVGIATVVHLLIVTFAGTFHRFLDDPKRSLWVRRVLALALALTAIWFGWSTRAA
ncbi:LysE family translocator [Litorimonas sp. WD9-15]|uniref:LysE family translocator n=1 Tax=Litorimonas sp. WD9-15 TaxID=3418716 RepID=UPI003D010705